MARSTISATFVLSIALYAAAIAGRAAAQGTEAVAAPSRSNGIETVVVTARKRAENIQAVPQTVTAIDADTIKNSHLTSLEDLSSFATNLDIVERADNTPDVTLRGVGSFGVIQGVGFYVNDVQQFEGQTVRPIDIESIEVLKGPQGTLYGGSNIGGAIKYTTKLPTDEPSAEATAEWTDENGLAVEGALSGPIVGDQLLGRVSWFTSRDDGFIFDPFLHGTLGHESERGARITLEYLDGPTTVRFYFSGDRYDTQSENLYYTPPDDHTYVNAPEPITGGPCIPPPGVSTVCDGLVPSYERELYAPTLQIEHDFGGATLTSISSYFHSWIKSVGDLDKSPLPIATYVQNFDKSVWSEEMRLASSDSSSPWKWLVGGFAQGIDSYTDQLQLIGLAAITGKLGDNEIIAIIPDAFGHTQANYAIFGNTTYDFGPWSFEGGLRVAYYDNRMGDTTAALNVPPSLNLTLFCQPCSGSVKRVETLPMASVSYHFSDDDMAYFTIARGFEPSDLTDEPVAIAGTPAQYDDVHDYKPEYALSYELGVKSTLLDDRLRLNGDVFYLDYANRLFETGTFVGQQISTFLSNVGSSHNYGIELDAEYVPVEELTLSGGLGLTRAVFDRASINILGVNYNLQGKNGPDTPDYQATLAADWRHPLTDTLALGVRVDARLFGRVWWDGLDRFEQRPYQVVNAGLRLEYGDHWVLAANVKNIFNERYNTFYADQSETGAPFNVAGVGAPRQAFVSLTVRY